MHAIRAVNPARQAAIHAEVCRELAGMETILVIRPTSATVHTWDGDDHGSIDFDVSGDLAGRKRG